MKFRILIDSLLVGKDAQNHFTDAIYYEPEDLAEDNYARVFLQIEILDNPKSSRLITQTILDTIKASLYQDLKKNPYKAFEETLKIVNKELSKIKHDYKDWIGKVNATIGVLSGNTLHVTVTGSSELVLIRKENTSIISEGLAPENNIYDDLFVNIASGNLIKEDILLLSSKSIFEKLSEEQLINAVNKKQLANSILSLEKLLDDKYHSALVISVQTAFKQAYELQEEELKIEDIEPENEEGQEVKAPKPLLKDSTKKYLKKGKGAFLKLKEIFVPPEGSSVLDEEVSLEDIDEESYSEQSSTEHIQKLKEIEGINQRNTLDDIKNATNLDTISQNNLEIPLDQKENKLLNTINLFKNNFVQSLKGTKPSRKVKGFFKKGNIIGIIVLLLIITFAVNSIHSKYQENQEIEMLKGKLLAVDTLIEKAKGRNIIDEKEKAREVLAEIAIEMNILKESKYLQNEIEDKSKEIAGLKDSINEVIRIDIPKEYANLEAKYDGINAIDIVFLKDTIYAVSKDTLLKLVLDQVVVIPVTILNEGEEIIEAASFETEDSILLYTNNNRLLEYKKDKFKEYKLLDENRSFENAVALGSFGRRVYFLDSSKNQVWKYTKQGLGFQNPIEYKPKEVDLSNMLDMSIVGDIYYLKQGGEIVRTNSQDITDFEFNELPANTDLSQAKRIEMNPTLKQLFILDPANNRILITGYRGYYAKQFVFPAEIGKIKDIFTNENTHKLYLLTSKKVYEVDIES